MCDESKKKEMPDEEQFKEFHEKLQSVDKKSAFFQRYPPRSLPCFERSKLKIGHLLGIGGFCDVSEVLALDLKLDEDPTNSINNDDDKNDNNDNNYKHEMAINNGDGIVNDKDNNSGKKMETVLNEEDTLNTSSVTVGSEDLDRKGYVSPDGFDGHDQFSDIKEMKQYMVETCMREGDSRYAIKVLRKDLTKKDHQYGVMDLAVEAKFLASIVHPNIIKMRGTAPGDPLHKDFFLVLDKLYDTLDQRIKTWSDISKVGQVFCGCCGGDKRELLLDRMTVAYDLSSAFLHLHQQGLIYRDIKLENIGFDIRGDVKLFDFGLCKELKAEDKLKDGLYKLTKQTGSFRYMAPENAKGEHYDQRVDVYSFGILLWEILSLKTAFETFDVPDFKKVFNQGYRPPVPASIPISIRALIKECWSGDLNERPNFSRIANLIRGEMKDLSDATDIMNRTSHMLNRSRTSGHIHLKTLNKFCYSEDSPKTQFMARASSSEIK